MLETTHALVAGAIVSHTKDPVAAILLSYVSHFLMDAVPHWDFGTNWRNRRKLFTGLAAIADMLVGFGAAYILFGRYVPLPLLFACITVSILPDWMETPWYIFFANHTKKKPGRHAGFFEKLTFRIYKIENTFHTKTNVFFGIATQIATVLFFWYLLR